LVLEGDPVDAAELRIGTYLLTSELVTRDRGESVLQVALVDAWGNHLRFTTEDIQWTWPKGFETTPWRAGQLVRLHPGHHLHTEELSESDGRRGVWLPSVYITGGA
jgi:hypothetical protein